MLSTILRLISSYGWRMTVSCGHMTAAECAVDKFRGAQVGCKKGVNIGVLFKSALHKSAGRIQIGKIIFCGEGNAFTSS